MRGVCHDHLSMDTVSQDSSKLRLLADIEFCQLFDRVSADLGSFVGLGDSPGGGGQMGNSSVGSLAPSPFKLPASYEEAKERKVAAVSDLRNAVKAVSLALHS